MLRLFYACYFVSLGVLVPFFPPYLRGLGLSGRQIGIVLAVAPLMHLGVPLAWGWLADRTRRPDRVLQLVCGGAFLFFLPLVGVRSMPALLAVWAGHQLFAVAILGLTDGLALERVRAGEDYSRIRIWGTLTFGLTCAALGPVLAARGGRPGDPLVPGLLAAALGLAVVASLGLRGHGVERDRPHPSEVALLLRDRRFVFLLVMAPLHWMCTTPYHGFFAILLEDRGLSPTVVGTAFALSIVAELVVLYGFRTLRARFGLRALMALSFSAGAVRWWIVAVAHDPLVLAGVQTLHALSFAVFWVAALAWVGECVSPSLRATGQALFTAATFGIGSTLGILGTGAIYDAAGSATPAFLLAGTLELVPLVLVLTKGRGMDPVWNPGR